MARYVTEFHLTHRVNDLDAAREYLQADNMTEYLIDDLDYLKLTRLQPSDIVNLQWDLQDEQYGLIYLDTAIDLTDDELAKISEWVSGQNSDGLGEGFEQQDFASGEDWEEYEYEDEDGETQTDYEEVSTMASFDWKTNNYTFKKVSDSQRVNDFYYNEDSGTVKKYSDLSYQNKDLEVIQTYEYAFSYLINNLNEYVDINDEQAVRDYITEQVYIFVENDPMFDREQMEMHGVIYDDQFTVDLIDYLINKIYEE